MKKVLYLLILFLTFIGCKSSVSSEVGEAQLPAIAQATISSGILLPLNEEEERMIPWRSLVGTTKYDWNGKDLLVTKNGAKTQRMFYNIWREDVANMAIEDKKTSQTLDSYFLPLAVTDDLVSFQHEIGYLSGASAWSEWRFETRNISKPGSLISLTAYFSDVDIYRSLMANKRIASEVEKAISEKKIVSSPESLTQLSSFLTDYNHDLFDSEFALEKDYLSRFAFHHIEGDQIFVWITLRPTSHAGQAMQDYIDISLPLPKSLENRLREADSGKEGFLMKNSINKVGNKSVTFAGKRLSVYD